MGRVQNSCFKKVSARDFAKPFGTTAELKTERHNYGV
jgi:hypothetical protein